MRHYFRSFSLIKSNKSTGAMPLVCVCHSAALKLTICQTLIYSNNKFAHWLLSSDRLNSVLLLCTRRVRSTLTTPEYRATKATCWTSSGIPSTTTASPPAPRTPRSVHAKRLFKTHPWPVTLSPGTRACSSMEITLLPCRLAFKNNSKSFHTFLSSERRKNRSCNRLQFRLFCMYFFLL